jgi:hypothetical protein
VWYYDTKQHWIWIWLSFGIKVPNFQSTAAQKVSCIGTTHLDETPGAVGPLSHLSQVPHEGENIISCGDMAMATAT